jgi:hypothetical protein
MKDFKMTFNLKGITLLIFPTSTTIIKDVKLSTIKILKKNKISVSQIIMEKKFFSVYTKEYIKAARILSSSLGIKKIEIAYSVSNKAKFIINKILNLGQKIIMHEKFYIKILSDNPNFIARDLEFMATGLLIEKLANKSSIPSKDEQSANKIIITYIGKSTSYISFKSIKGIGGMTFGYLKKKVFIIIYDQYSIYCLKNVILRGFIPNILILFWDCIDLKNKLFSIHNVLNNIHNNKIKLQLLQLNFLISKEKYNKNNLLLDIIVIDICSYLNTLINVILSFNLFVHPMWLIEYSLLSCIQKGKVPWFPCLFEENLLINLPSNDKVLKSSFSSPKENFTNFKERYRIRNRSIDFKQNIKSFYIEIKPLNVRPNYIDHILNSI